jgi:hypothetical protein
MKTTQLVESLWMTPQVLGSILRLRGTSTAPIATPNGIAELEQVELNGYPQWCSSVATMSRNPCSSSCMEVLANRTYGSPTTP